MTSWGLSLSVCALGAALAAGASFAQQTDGPRGDDPPPLSASLQSQLLQQADALYRRGGWVARAERSLAAKQAVAGDLAIVAVPALFADSPEPVVSVAELEFSLFTGLESLHAFYVEASGDRLHISGQATDWVRTNLTREYVVGDDYGLGSSGHVGEYLVDALSLVDPGFDFGQFDNDGPDDIPNSGDDNGIVDVITFYFLEVAASCGGPGIWPHFFGLTPKVGAPFETDDVQPDGTPIVIDHYFIQSIVDCSGTGISPITAIAHELGHLIGLPDLYHPVDGLLPEERRWVVGCWSVMAAGGWGCGPVDTGPTAERPTHPGAWEKERLGWLEHVRNIDGKEILEIQLDPVQTSYEILEISLGDEERLLVEYRATIGFDQDLPASGVLVYSINDTLPSRPCDTCPAVYRVMLLEADGDSALVKTHPQGGDRGVAGDAFGILGPGELTNITEPSTRNNSGLGGETDVNIYRITIEDGIARILVSSAPISGPRLAGPLLGDHVTTLTEPEADYLDRRNNGNGRYDVGDLRAYLKRR